MMHTYVLASVSARMSMRIFTYVACLFAHITVDCDNVCMYLTMLLTSIAQNERERLTNTHTHTERERTNIDIGLGTYFSLDDERIKNTRDEASMHNIQK
jgi:hypothetical protein